jgi:stage III sporulation protein AD
MDIVKIYAFAFVGIVTALSVKKNVPCIALVITVACGLVILYAIMPQLRMVSELIENVSEMQSTTYVSSIIKIIGIAYIAQLASAMCSDFGFTALGGKVELAGKVMILTFALPMLQNLFTVINTLLGA